MSFKSKQMIVVGVILLAAVLIGVMVPVVMAHPLPTFTSPVPPPEDEWPPVPDVDTGSLTDYVSAIGLGAVITVVIEILKRLSVIPDGQAGRWATIANVVAFAGLVVAGVFGVDYSGDQAAAIFDLLHRIGQAVLTIISSPIFFQVLRGAGVLPKMASHK